MSKQILFDKQNFICSLFSWFEQNKRDLPWRKTYSPYHVWISEMMLQQTQMERGVRYFNRWMQEFPTPDSIAESSLEKILQLWEGLGYYSRARNIYASAKIISNTYNGKIPCDEAKIRSLAGIGEYTLSAIMGIAFEKDYAVVDANVERVFARLFNCTDKNLKKAVKPLAQELLPHGKARTYNQALMELGALVCKKIPQCANCPLVPYCESRKLNLERERPVPKKKKEIIPVLASFCIITNSNNEELLRQRTNQKLWNTLWEYFGIDTVIFDNASSAEEKQNVARQSILIEISETFKIPKAILEENISDNAFCVISNYTNHKLTAYFFSWHVTKEFEQIINKNISGTGPYVWTKNTEQSAMPSHHRKAHQNHKEKG